MKKVFLTVSRGSIARNLLQNEFYYLLREKYQVVVLTPAFQDKRFLEEFAHHNVRCIHLPHMERSFLDMLLFFFHKHLIYNSTVNQKARWGIIGDSRSTPTPYPLYVIKRGVFTVLSRVFFLRDFVRYLDRMFTQRKEVGFWKNILEEERPDMVISTNIAEDIEVALLKAARDVGIRTLGMPKSWDNASKNGFRVKADDMVVWNMLMEEEMLQFQNYTKKHIHSIGVPQFDYYLDTSRIVSREVFCSWFGFDPHKKIILFSSEGKLFAGDGEIASVIYDAIQKEYPEFPCQLLIRPHYGFKQDEQKFKHLFGKHGVAVDLENHPSMCFRDAWDYSKESMDRFLNMLYHCDIDINTHSSLALDVIGFDKPIISLLFDSFEKKPYERSIARWYETYYYRNILSFHATTEVGTPQELEEALHEYLLNPSHKKEERRRLRDAFCFLYDGHAGKRFFEVVQKLID